MSLWIAERQRTILWSVLGGLGLLALLTIACVICVVRSSLPGDQLGSCSLEVANTCKL